jgi:hypothetical protein
MFVHSSLLMWSTAVVASSDGTNQALQGAKKMTGWSPSTALPFGAKESPKRSQKGPPEAAWVLATALLQPTN